MPLELIFTAFSGLLLVAGVSLWQKGNRLLSKGKKAEAVVFKNNFEPSKSGGMYYPVIRFTTDTQEWITTELHIGSRPAIAEGTKLEVLYDPEDPHEVTLNNFFMLVVLPRLLTAVGLVGFVCSLLVYLELIQIGY